MKKLAIVIGHNQKRQGAVRVDNGASEFRFNTGIAQMMLGMSRNLECRIFEREYTGRYSSEIDQVYRKVDDWGADASLELHFNGSGDPRATGTETLSSGSRGSMALARFVHAEMLDAMDLRDRGIKVVGKGDRGGRSLWAGRAPAILVEPFFGSNPLDCRNIDSFEEENELAAAYLAGAHAFLR